jgi:hypothetical protein
MLLCDAWATGAPLTFVSGTVTDDAGRTRTIELPYLTEDEPSAGGHHYELAFRAAGTPRPRLRVLPDDCVRSLHVNGVAVDLSRVGSGRLCDFHSGFDVDVGRLLHQGDNRLTVDVDNLAGRHGLAIYSLRAGPWWGWASLVAGFLLLPACFVALGALRLSPTHRWIAAALVALAGWVRYHYVFEWHPPEAFAFSDMGLYVERARDILAGGTDPEQAFQPIGYPLLLALSLRLGRDLALVDWTHVVAGWLTVVLVWRASARWLRGWSHLAVLAIAALHFPFIALSGFFMAETVFTLQLALLVYCLSRFPFPWKPTHALVLGAVYMSGLWFKGNNTFFGPLAIVWIAAWIFARRRSRFVSTWVPLARRVVVPIACFVAGAALVVASHAAYTRVHFGAAQISAPTSSLNFVEGKCPWKVNVDSRGRRWHSPLFIQLGENDEKRWPRPFTDTGYFWHQGLECVRRDPAVVATSLRYVYYLFFDNQLWPVNATTYGSLSRWYGMAFAGLLFPSLLLGAILVARRPRSRLALVGMMTVSIALCSWVFKSEMRYRVPFDVVFIPLAVMGIAWLAARLRREKKKDERLAPAPAEEAALTTAEA